ncbi:MAG: sarcosine oxidase subunit delta [Sneathiella sp.]
MLLIECPWCGKRHETEFQYGGEAHIARPEHPEELTDQQWADFLFMKTNTKGVFRERWNHSNGCRRWFNAIRHTVSHEILAVYKMGDEPPKIEAGEADK